MLTPSMEPSPLPMTFFAASPPITAERGLSRHNEAACVIVPSLETVISSRPPLAHSMVTSRAPVRASCQ